MEADMIDLILQQREILRSIGELRECIGNIERILRDDMGGEVNEPSLPGYDDFPTLGGS